MTADRSDGLTQRVADQDRGQLILIGGLTIAVVLVALALILNSAIYTQNLATRAELGTEEVIEHRGAVVDGTADALRLANYGDEDTAFTQRDQAVESNLSAWKSLQRRYHVADTAAVDNRIESTTEGVRVTQQSPGPLDPANPDLLYELQPLGLTGQNWLVAKSVGIREYRLTLQRDSMPQGDVDGVLVLLDGNDGGVFDPEETFSVHIEDGDGDEWRLFVYRSTDNADRVNVTVMANGDGTWDHIGTCAQETEEIRLDIGRGTIRGDEGFESCPALSDTSVVSDPYDVYYVNGNDAAGTYSFIANETEPTFRDDVAAENDDLLNSLGGVLIDGTLITDVFESDTYHDEPTDGDPYTTSAVYQARIDIYYRTNRITYDSMIRVAPYELTTDGS